MWKKDDVTPPTPPRPEPREKPLHNDPPKAAPAASERATIGRSITIRGEVEGDEDLLIQGRVDGSVDLKDQSVTVGREGRVKANITGRVVAVEGEVEGDLRANEQVVLRSSARVQGDITAPRVVLEDGANFRGLVDMADSSQSGVGSAKTSAPSGKAEEEKAKAEGEGSSKTTTGGSTETSSGSSGAPAGKGKDTPASAGKTAS